MTLTVKPKTPAFDTAYQSWQQMQALLAGDQLVLDGTKLDIGAVAAVAYHGCLPRLTSDPAILEAMEASVRVLTDQLDKGYHVYGVNTGFGGSADARTTQLHALQVALLQHTQAGILAPIDRGARPHTYTPGQMIESHAMPAPWVRAAIAVRCNSTVRGHSAVSSEVVRALLRLLEHGITPIVPLRGSVSASGDLMPLSYIAGAVEGNPDIYVQVDTGTGTGTGTDRESTIMTAREALLSTGLDARSMGPKEGLSIVNGTSSSAAVASLVLFEAHQLAVLVQAMSGMAVEALLGNAESFHPFISAVRPHTGQTECASNVLSLLQGSQLAQGLNSATKDRTRTGLVQDRYALRSIPQWIGPQLEDLVAAHGQVTTELNSSCDNPLVDAASDDIYYGCNFQAVSITSAMEKTRLALQMLGKLVFAQATELIEPHLNNGLPTNLVADDPNLSFTMKGVDTNMAAYMAELAHLAHPVSSHIQAAEMHNQSVNSMALATSRFSMQAVEILSIMCACHVYVACQALDLRALHLKFVEQAPAVLSGVTAQLVQISDSDKTQLEAALKVHICSTWPKLNTLSSEDRCKEVARSALDVLVEFFSGSSSSSPGLSVHDLREWKSLAAVALDDSYKATAARFFANPHTEELLGRGSRAVYRTVRHTLGVPVHLGFQEHPTAVSDSLHGRDKKTIGSWISIIYEAVRGDLRIELAAPPHWTFAPGDTVIGTIVRTSHLVTPKATLEVRLTGYTETQISEFVGTYNKYNSTGLDMFGTTDMYGRSTKNHRAVWDILPVWTYEILYNKTLHIAQGQAQDGTQDGTQTDAQSWSIPFEVTIPAHPGRKEIMQHHKPEESYLPIDEESVASQTLPGSFLACKPLGYTSDISCDAVISYQIEARLRYTHGGKPEVIKAVCPVTVRHAQRPPEYDSDRLVYKRSLAATIQTHRLVPALRDKNARLSFSQKRQQFFGSSKVPQYTFRVEFGLPHSLFLAGPGAAGDADESVIPLTVAIIPDPNPNRTSASLQGVVQTLQVRSVRVSLDAVTEVRVVSGYGNKKIRTAQTVYPHAVSASMLSPSQRGPVDLVASHEKATSAVDIGALIGLRMGGKGLRRNGTSYQFDKEALYPDFTSYLIKHSHKLSCEVEICLAEESKWVKTTAAVVVN